MVAIADGSENRRGRSAPSKLRPALRLVVQCTRRAVMQGADYPCVVTLLTLTTQACVRPPSRRLEIGTSRGHLSRAAARDHQHPQNGGCVGRRGRCGDQCRPPPRRGLFGLYGDTCIFPLSRSAQAARRARRRSVIDCLEAIMREGKLNSRTTPQGPPPEAVRS